MVAALLTAATIAAPIQYWTPAGTNSWVGDVTVVNFRDRLHLFYLHDEHHHQAYGGKGGHVFRHLSSPDLKTWEEHPVAVAKDEPWDWIGTGTPLVMKDRLYLFYGLHSSRNGDGWELKYPKGGSYAVSEDGIRFAKSHDIFTDDENPSPFWMKDGRLGIIHSGFSRDRGWWAADRLSGPWLKVDDTIPTEGDCPCPFEWNGWHYVIQGFVSMAASPTGRPGTYEDWVLAGEDVYGGMSVPMVVDWKNGRKLLVGWINGLDRYHEVPSKDWAKQVWGGWLCFRELVQFSDGRLGSKWLAETPNPGATTTYDCSPDRPFVLTFRNRAGKTVEFRVDPQEARAQFSDDGRRHKTLAEVCRGLDPNRRRGLQILEGLLDVPYSAENYAIGRIRGLDRPFKVRFGVYYDPKADGTIFDAEIAGTRTILARASGEFVQKNSKEEER